MIELLKYCLLLFVTTTSLGFSIGLLLNSRKITILQGHWAGFITLIVILQFWSIFLPVNWNILFLILTLSVPGFLLLARTMPARISTQWRSLPLFTLAAVLPLVFLLYSGCKNVTWYDTPLYHLNAVRWINDFAVVPGLANLHERFGFNSSFLLFGAFTNIGPASGSASHIALPYLLCITVCEMIWRATRQGRGLGIILAVLFIPYFLDRGYSSESASLSTDLSTNCIMCVAILYMTDRPTRFNLILVAGLCSLAFVFKLTAFPVLLCWGTYLVLQWLRKRDSNAYVLVLPAIILGGFAIRNVIVSGSQSW
ncbi:MAG: hypothetical protein K8S54_14290 [Spirochaetia bacterium]|nr:hypothetical protein [Spirochaetia bacterium]